MSLRDRVWDRRTVVVESRFSQMPLNTQMYGTETPTQANGNPNLRAALNLVRAVAGLPEP